MWQKSYDNSPTLYLVPTPIGNLDDMTFRAIDTLKNVDVVFAEDTRVSSDLFKKFDIKNKLVSLHNFNEDSSKEKVIEFLKVGSNVAIITDRGTPLISDPGYKSVKCISDMGYNVVSLPGATAFVPALTSSGLPTDHFLFYGFLNSNSNKCELELRELSNYEYTMIFYEAPHRFYKTMELLFKVFGDRIVSVSREISKKFESVYRGNISDLIKLDAEIKGEIVIVVSGNIDVMADNDLSIKDAVDNYVRNGITVMNAIKMVSKDRKIPKNEVYKEYHGG